MSRPTQISYAHLEGIAGGANVITDAAELAAREVCGVLPAVVVRPTDAAQIAEILRFAGAEKLAVIPTSGCTKLGIGSPPTRYDIALDLSLMNRVLAYDPNDLTLGVEPGMRIEELLRILGEQKQFLPLAVPFMERATVGGIVAANSSSPLRHAYGAVRDFCLGMEFVTGEGSQAKSGGRVVKNVTGYDLHKLLIGSLGTLAVITRVNFRTFPMPQAQGTFLASFSSVESAIEFCSAVSHSVLTPQILEVADSRAALLILSGVTSARIEPDVWSVILSAAGVPTVVERTAHELGRMANVAKAEEFAPLSTADAASVLAQIREFPRLILDAAPDAAIFRISAVPDAMPWLLVKLRALAGQNDLEFAALVRASGILYAAFLPGEDHADALAPLQTAIPEVFRICSQPEFSASAMLEWCPTEIKTGPAAVWGPARGDFELMRRVKILSTRVKCLLRDDSRVDSDAMTEQVSSTAHIQETQPRSGFSGSDIPDYDVYSHCVHCGLCLNQCPTYKLWGLEADSPRGRIRQ